MEGGRQNEGGGWILAAMTCAGILYIFLTLLRPTIAKYVVEIQGNLLRKWTYCRDGNLSQKIQVMKIQFFKSLKDF